MDMFPLQVTNPVALLLVSSVNKLAGALKCVFQPQRWSNSAMYFDQLIIHIAITPLQFMLFIKGHRDKQIKLINFLKSRYRNHVHEKKRKKKSRVILLKIHYAF